MFSQRTTTALLNGLHQPGNAAAWNELDGRCRPIMIAVCRRMGLGHAEAEDAVQSALTAFYESYREGLYERARGRLSVYIITILRSRAIDARRRAVLRKEMNQPIEFIWQHSESDIERFWLQERQSQILRQAIQLLRDEGVDEQMMTAFELYGIRGVSADHVASQLNMTRDQVYQAKHRITRRLQPVVARVEELYEDV